MKVGASGHEKARRRASAAYRRSVRGMLGKIDLQPLQTHGHHLPQDIVELLIVLQFQQTGVGQNRNTAGALMSSMAWLDSIRNLSTYAGFPFPR